MLHFAPFLGHLRRVSPLQAHSSPRPMKISISNHPQVAQCEKHVQLRGVLGQSAVAHLHVTKLALDDSKRVLDSGADAGFDFLHAIEHLPQLGLLVQRPSLAWAHGHMPLNIQALRFFAFAHALIARVSEHIGFFAMNQGMRLRDIVDVGRIVCTSPDSMSTPMCAFIPKCH